MPQSLSALLKTGLRDRMMRKNSLETSGSGNANNMMSKMRKGLTKKVFKTAKIMNKKVGDRGFYNLRKQYGELR
jgi:hypothetical protein